jgi:hypothetical protein
LREIGGALKFTEVRISQMVHISQIIHRALAKLKERPSEELEFSGGR